MTGWTEDGLASAWRALALQEAGEVWRFVRLANIGTISIEAGRQFPQGREALIVAFPGASPVDPARLPEAQGFDVMPISGIEEFADRTAIALVRRVEGSHDLFSTIAVDVLRTIEAAAAGTGGGADVLEAFLQRVKEWQAFMARSHRPLSTDAQTGLFGELWMLRALGDTTLSEGALDCWLGPLRAAQDFRVRGIGIEVKSTTRTGNFIARINSIDQLDGDMHPVFLCVLRFQESARGVSLAGLVDELRQRFATAGSRRGFDALLMVMGYLDDHAALYGRLLELESARTFRCDGDMPRLTRATLPAAIRSAIYTLDLDALEAPALALSELLADVGLEHREP